MMRSKLEAATVAGTHDKAMPRIEIVGERRRSHAAAFRRMVVAEAGVAGARVQDVAARHGICPSLVYRWRRSGGGMDSSAVHLYPVRIADAPDPSLPGLIASSSPAVSRPRAGVIEIELAGGVRVRVDESVSIASLRRVLSVLRG